MNGPDRAKPAAPKQQFKASVNSGMSSGATLDGARKQAASPLDTSARKAPTPQPRAWQGLNPITQRGSNASPGPGAVPNGTDRTSIPPRAAMNKKSPTESNIEKQANERALYLLATFTGRDATLTLKSGEQFTGIFSAASVDNPAAVQYILKMVKRTRLPNNQQANGGSSVTLNEYIGEGEDHTMVFDKDETYDLAVTDVKLANGHKTQNGSLTPSFRTDTEISGQPAGPRQRELQRWVAAPSDPSMDMSLDSAGAGGWDQFATNERLYGVQSTYDENIYTTVIDRTNPAYRQREAEAARIAREIEGSAPANAHVAEERRRDADGDDGVDEEDKYSGVKRDLPQLPKRAAGAYVPPSQRPITNAPTVPGAPFDPAIISSQLASPVPSETHSKPKEETKPSVPIPSEEQTLPSAERSSSRDKRASILGSNSRKGKESSTEDYMRDLTDSFKQFANNEKLRVRQAQEAKRSSQKAEKIVKLNDLKKFSENFKLKSRVPDDLVPILAKDREKQVQIQSKAEQAAKEEESRAKEREKEKTTAPAPAPAPVPPRADPMAQPSNNNNGHQRGSGFANHRSQMSQTLAGAFTGAGPSRDRRNGPFQGQPNHSYRQPIEPLPQNLRDLHKPPTHEQIRSPSAAPKLNINAKAFEFKPGAAAFTPTGTSPSPQRPTDRVPVLVAPAQFFEPGKKHEIPESSKLDDMYTPMKALREGEYTDEQKRTVALNKGIPRPFQTPPLWPVVDDRTDKSYKDSFVKPQQPSQALPPMHSAVTGHIGHPHQLAHHMQQPQMSGPPQRGPFAAPPHHLHGPPSFDHNRVQQFGPNGSVHNSPRVPPLQMTFGPGQVPSMPQYNGQPMPFPGMSPSMAYRQIPPNQQGLMMMGQSPGPVPQMPQNYQRGPGPYPPQMMAGGIPMVNQHSASFPGGPMAQQGGYSPLPPQAQPHLPHNMAPQQHGNPAGYTGSPRPGPHMMQHSGSHQGGFIQPGGSPMPMGPQHHHMPGAVPGPPPAFAMPGSAQPHAFHMAQHAPPPGPQRFPQMTPRQQHAVPQRAHGSPGMPMVQGDEGK